MEHTEGIEPTFTVPITCTGFVDQFDYVCIIWRDKRESNSHSQFCRLPDNHSRHYPIRMNSQGVSILDLVLKDYQ